MVMVAVPVPGPPQVPGAVGHTSSAPESWMMKVAVLGPARAPLAVMTVATPERAMVMTAMAISRLPIERSFPLGRTSASGCCQVNHRPSGLVPVLLGAFGSCTARADGDAHGLGGTSRGRRPLGFWSAHLGYLATARAGRRRRPRRCGLPRPTRPSKAGRQAEVMPRPSGVLPWASQPPPVDLLRYLRGHPVGSYDGLRHLGGVAVHSVEV